MYERNARSLFPEGSCIAASGISNLHDRSLFGECYVVGSGILIAVGRNHYFGTARHVLNDREGNL